MTQFQLVDSEGLEPGASGFQVWCFNNSVVLPPCTRDPLMVRIARECQLTFHPIGTLRQERDWCDTIIILSLKNYTRSCTRRCTLSIKVGGGGVAVSGGLEFSLPATFNPGSRPAQCCIIFSHFYRFPPSWESRFPLPLLPPPLHLPPFLLGPPP